ncbi:hypothetical protein [Pseudodesulfovibrio indicus]|uniref:hypothetical protein n=1 Tax=Pseudodesulfovibrio indicus TaxID=1716143 RepID=UPI00292DB041|nr:hypothetical protein [Pseudodesulfovibrio indicus]
MKSRLSVFDGIRDLYPPVISRDHVEKYFGGIISSKRLANLDSQGLGPPRFRVGRKIAYRTDALLAWLEARTTVMIAPLEQKVSEGEQ